MLTVTELDNRLCPTFGVRDGFVYMPNQHDFEPFSDFHAAHAVAGDDRAIAVGAADGGAPRVQIRYDENVTADFYAYESTFRNGVNVAVGGGVVVTGAAPGGGPVIAVWDKGGNQISRFFAYDPDFRGGVSVAVRDGRILAVPGPGGGPLVTEWDFLGTPLGAWFGDDSERRDGWQIIAADVTHDRFADVTLVRPGGTSVINEALTGGQEIVDPPTGFDLIGYEINQFGIGQTGTHLRLKGIWSSFPRLSVNEFADGAAGNANPPPTTGFRPGVMVLPFQPSGLPPPGEVVLLGTPIGESVGAATNGTGTSFVPMADANGTPYLVTARHVQSSVPDLPVEFLPSIQSPGPGDGASINVADPVYASTIPRGQLYTVDAVAGTLLPGQSLESRVRFGNQFVSLDGVAENMEFGDVMIAVGRGRFLGVGNFDRIQEGPVRVNWGLPERTDDPLLADQFIVRRGVTAFAVPGFSGGPAIRLRWTADGVLRELVGMVVAGDGIETYVTPVHAIEQSLGLSVFI